MEPESMDNLEAELFLEPEPTDSLEADLFSEPEPLEPESMENLEANLFLEAEPLAPETMGSLENEDTATAADDLDGLLTEGAVGTSIAELGEALPDADDLDALLDLTEPTDSAMSSADAAMNRELDSELDNLLHNLTDPELPKREQFDWEDGDLAETLLELGEAVPATLPEAFPEDLDELLTAAPAIDHDKLNRFADDVTAEDFAEIVDREPLPAVVEITTELETIPALWAADPEASTVLHIEDRIQPELDTYSATDPWFLGLDFGQRTVQAALGNVAVGKVYSLTIEEMAALPNQISHPEVGLLSEYTQLLRMGVPYRSGNAWQPVVQWSPSRAVDLQTLRQGVELLLTRLGNGAAHPRLPESLPPIAGVAFGIPTDWPDTYAVNLREALLRAGLVASSERAIAVEQPLALFLHLLHTRPDLSYPVLILDAGTLSTQLLLARGPERPLVGTRGLDYGGSGLNEDIAARLLYPYWRRSPSNRAIPVNWTV
ncbi:MAG: hypothetical protein HC918_11660 [Oscillatoriales cyanobacterium SM2_1_8]|nr:hypothetical protein [Oscillatoriales cyanobacterium SM2_1_8]